MKRWSATIFYRSEKTGNVDVQHDFDELEDLHDLVERGPNFYAIEQIVIVANRTDLATTLEASEAA